jgi:hypothetical protein
MFWDRSHHAGLACMRGDDASYEGGCGPSNEPRWVNDVLFPSSSKDLMSWLRRHAVS